MADVEAIGGLISRAAVGVPLPEIYRTARDLSDRAVGLGPNKVMSVPTRSASPSRSGCRRSRLQQDLLETTRLAQLQPSRAGLGRRCSLRARADRAGFHCACPDCARNGVYRGMAKFHVSVSECGETLTRPRSGDSSHTVPGDEGSLEAMESANRMVTPNAFAGEGLGSRRSSGRTPATWAWTPSFASPRAHRRARCQSASTCRSTVASSRSVIIRRNGGRIVRCERASSTARTIFPLTYAVCPAVDSQGIGSRAMKSHATVVISRRAWHGTN